MQIAKSIFCSAVVVATVISAVEAQQPVTLTATDGVKVFGTYYEAKNQAAPVILLFHQAESNRYEYASIAPRLIAAGFNVLAINQRSGDSMWGHKNETVVNLGKSTDYVDALPDMKAALEWAHAKDRKRKVILWGSSYSASLVFVLGADNPSGIAGILAFSPDEYFANKHMAIIPTAFRSQSGLPVTWERCFR
jgi:dienelactone hydrolase